MERNPKQSPVKRHNRLIMPPVVRRRGIHWYEKRFGESKMARRIRRTRRECYKHTLQRHFARLDVQGT